MSLRFRAEGIAGLPTVAWVGHNRSAIGGLLLLLLTLHASLAAAQAPESYRAIVGTLPEEAFHGRLNRRDSVIACPDNFFESRSADVTGFSVFFNGSWTRSYFGSGPYNIIPSLPLRMVNGQWIPAYASEEGQACPHCAIVASGPWSRTSVLSAGGIVSTVESFTAYIYVPYIDGRLVLVSSIRDVQTFDLNTGKYTYREVYRSAVPDCLNSLVITIAYEPAYLPITLVPELEPPETTLSVVNPFASSIRQQQALQSPPEIPAESVLSAPPAIGLSADGRSAVVVALRSTSNAPVSFTLSAPRLTTTGAIGSLSSFTPTYLSNPAPSGGTELTIGAPNLCDPDGTHCLFLALLWSPFAIPVSAADLAAGSFLSLGLSIRAVQEAHAPAEATVMLHPPPLLLVHGLWSDAGSWGDGAFLTNLATEHPGRLVHRVDYGPFSHKSYADPDVQDALLRSLREVLATAAANGVAARQVDVVAHSMGGLATRHFLSYNPSAPRDPVHKLITVGTPHSGTPLAYQLLAFRDALPTGPGSSLIQLLCAARGIAPCTLANFLGDHRRIDTGVEDLRTGLPADSTSFRAIAGQSPETSNSEQYLDFVIGAFIPGYTDDVILGPAHDTIVPVSSQLAGAVETATVAEVVHTVLHLPELPPFDVGETESAEVWRQVLYWLMNGQGQLPSPAAAAIALEDPPPPIFDLTGYTRVDASNVELTPATGTTLAINETATITAASATKTLAQILLFQTVAGPDDALLLSETAPPFSIRFTPARLGTADFVAVAVFADQTFAMTNLHYDLQPAGAAIELEIVNVPVANLPIDTSIVVGAVIDDPSGSIDVTSAATYAARSGTAAVFSVSPGGVITTTGHGVDWLDVTYGGRIASAPIACGDCAFAVTPIRQFVAMGGEAVASHVSTAPDCSWAASTAAAWVSGATGIRTGNGTLTFTVTANTTGAERTSTITVADREVVLTQPSVPCTYDIGQATISVPAAGGSGSVDVSTACPIVPIVDATWVVAFRGGASVVYSAMANATASPRTATITVGTRTITITQQAAAPAAPAITLHPYGRTIEPGMTAAMNVAATGSALSYQWYVGPSPTTSDPIQGAASSSYTTPPLSSTTSYWVRVSSSLGSADSSTATISVNIPFFADGFESGDTSAWTGTVP